MKRKNLAFFVLLLMAMCPPIWAAEVVISTGEFAPWTGETLPYGGYANRIVREAFLREGVSVRLRYTSWPRAIALLRHGDVVASSYWAHDPVRDKAFLLSDSLFEDRWLLFHLRTTSLPKWRNLSDLSNYRFGLTRSYTYTRELWDLVERGALKALVAPDDATNQHNLLAGLVDIVPMDQISGWMQLSATLPGARELMSTEEQPLNITPAYLLLSNSAEGERLRTLFNAALAKMKADGTLERYKKDLYRDSPP